MIGGRSVAGIPRARRQRSLGVDAVCRPNHLLPHVRTGVQRLHDDDAGTGFAERQSRREASFAARFGLTLLSVSNGVHCTLYS